MEDEHTITWLWTAMQTTISYFESTLCEAVKCRNFLQYNAEGQKIK